MDSIHGNLAIAFAMFLLSSSWMSFHACQFIVESMDGHFPEGIWFDVMKDKPNLQQLLPNLEFWLKNSLYCNITWLYFKSTGFSRPLFKRKPSDSQSIARNCFKLHTACPTSLVHRSSSGKVIKECRSDIFWRRSSDWTVWRSKSSCEKSPVQPLSSTDHNHNHKLYLLCGFWVFRQQSLVCLTSLTSFPVCEMTQHNKYMKTQWWKCKNEGNQGRL